MNHLGDFYGNAKTASELDAVIAAYVKPLDFQVFAEQAEKRWFGYRDLHPGTALFLFMDRYTKSFQRFKRRDFGYNFRPTSTKPFKYFEMEPGVIKSFWSAMALADEFCLPYDFYCDFMFRRAEREGWPRPPRPNQIYASRLVVACKAEFETLCRDSFVKTRHPFYSKAQYIGHPWQEEYQDFLLASVSARSNPAMALVDVMIRDPQVTPQNASRVLGVQTVKDALYNAKL